MMKKIGILGGTFDPVHYGHLYLAEQARDEAKLDLVLLMPVKLQPFKLDKKVTDGADRLAMLQLAAEGRERISVSDYELSRPEISYTINTLRAVKNQLYPGSQVWFIIGTDAFLKIRIWKEPQELLTEYGYIVGARPGYREDELTACIDACRKVYNTDICRINNRQISVSSTRIKELVANGGSLENLVPAAVERYIYDKGLYQ